MPWKWLNNILMQVFWWFGIGTAVLGILVETSTQTVSIGTSSFYLMLSGVSFLAGIFKFLEEKR